MPYLLNLDDVLGTIVQLINWAWSLSSILSKLTGLEGGYGEVEEIVLGRGQLCAEA